MITEFPGSSVSDPIGAGLGRGLWAGAFITPSEQRRSNKEIRVLGVGAAVCNPTCLPPDAPPGCTIKET
jgi:hypothetical protein